LIVKFGASAISLYAVYNIYKIITTPKSDQVVKEEKPAEASGCGQGQGSCCQTETQGNAISCGTKSDRQKDKDGDCCGQDDCNKPKDDEQHVFGAERPQWNESSDEDDDDAFSIAGSQDGPLLDIEDLGSAAVAQMDDGEGSQDSGVTIHKKNEDMIEKFKNHKEMVDDTLRATLTKQGYKLVGSHAGVKMCRWTKSMLRGQGGCYKNTFYGIASHQCMESTTNLACASKCVFCWRHQRNPTGTEWKWKLDDAKLIFDGLTKSHYEMVKQFKGVPGVTPKALAEAKKLRHAALSLVGEPIMYPEMDKFIGMLHENGISSFLVTNGTFPECIKSIRQVTQLYLSVDAPTEKSHKAVDRPLHKDAWARFLKSCEYLSKRKERTIFRLTMVKGWNDEEMEQYGDLVRIGKPDFIEIKGVTYCGNSWAGNTDDKQNLTLKNVPFHEEVVEMCERITDSINEKMADMPGFEYQVMSEHAHSNCILIANKKKFFIDGVWHTHIDFDKFIELEQSGADFSAMDYTIPSPEWTIFGHESHGFNPEQTRTYRKGAGKRNAVKEAALARNLEETRLKEEAKLEETKQRKKIEVTL
jgi:tRNA wybutosine-synthesizing protein 1